MAALFSAGYFGSAADEEGDMETLYKTIYQYNQAPIADTDMERLREIARDCRDVKNYVYGRYGGIHSLSKLYPGYTVQNEMTKSGLRKQLGLPSVYFYPSIFDALGDIKSQWTRVKSRVEENIRVNPNLTPEDRHYLRFVMKQSHCFERILEGAEIGLEGDWQETYGKLCSQVDSHRLDQYLRRQVRHHLKKPHTETADRFTAAPKGYRYADHGIYLTMKERGKRLFIPLTDSHSYSSQVAVRLYPEENRVTLGIAVKIKPKHPSGYSGEVGVALGLKCMFVTDTGQIYGERYLEYQSAVTDYVRKKLPGHRRNAENNPGRKKYDAGKARLEQALHSYVNAEINRMLKTEKPGTVYFPKLPVSSKAGLCKRNNATVSMWQRGYVRQRLTQKCMERSICFAEVFAKGVSVECSACGATGKKERELFVCASCGLAIPERQNTARNVLKRGHAVQEERRKQRET